MERETLSAGGRRCAVYRTPAPRALLLQPVDERDMDDAPVLAQYILERAAAPFLLCVFPVEDWNGALSPWPAPAVYGREAFSGGSRRTLAYVTGALLPALRARYGLDGAKTVMGGYSLAGLFALWCGYETAQFDAVAAASPSVWYDGWMDYVNQTPIRTGAVYLSLGDREETARNSRLARVGPCIRRYAELLTAAAVPNTLVWERGNHFQDSAARTARGFLWTMNRILC